MHLFSTVLFVNGNPVGYEVKSQEGKLLLNPAENPSREIIPPVLRVVKDEGRVRVSGTTDRDLIDQVLEDVTERLPGYPS